MTKLKNMEGWEKKSDLKIKELPDNVYNRARIANHYFDKGEIRGFNAALEKLGNLSVVLDVEAALERLKYDSSICVSADELLRIILALSQSDGVVRLEKGGEGEKQV